MGEVAKDDLLVFSDEPERVSHSGKAPWQVLIADDDPEIHAVTKLALSDLVLEGRQLKFFDAYSGEEAISILEAEPDIAMVLLDVVMEAEDAGLKAVRRIREDLKNESVRIVLRTGQPGYAPEEEVITAYDINDYKTKTDLTRNKLLTTVVTALRSYRQLKTITQNRKGLEKIIRAAATLMERHSIINFSEGVVTQLASLLGMSPEGLLCVRTHKEDNTDDIVVLGAAGHYASSIQRSLSSINNRLVESAVTKCLETQTHIYLDGASVFYIEGKGHHAAAYLDNHRPLEDIDHQIIEIFLANISIGFENVNLFEELRTAAYRDPLTGLPNRAEFCRLLQFSYEEGHDHIYAICDVSHFSDVNETLGQEVGNSLLKAIGDRFQSSFSEDVVIARIGADVYGVIGPRKEVTPERIRQIAQEPYMAGEDRIPVQLVAGFTQTHGASTGLDILKQGYIALKAAKVNRLDGYAYFHPAMEEETSRRLHLVRRLRSDFRDEKLAVWYQPQVNISTGEVVGFEALLRWPQEDGSFIPPNEFIPLAEYSGLVVDIGAWVLEEACRDLQSLSDICARPLRMAVNVSIPQFRNSDFPSQVERVLKQYNISEGRLEIEITESIIMDDPETVIAILKRLRSEGVGVAVDDFGVGFSSLNYIQKLPISKLKIDRTFVQNSDTKSGAVIIETITRMGHELGLTTIAEGIETQEQRKHFEGLKIQEAQGFYFAKPMPLEQVQSFLKQTKCCLQEGKS
ncbi:MULTISPECIES: EAL domain-containing protein [Gammaproteobacteria]|uniref:GGDEF/EAL domain-containing response regulator n=1 Tax=Gammaproteobacteria TaxID=1236 RepID=UPI000DD02323|nr:MULTISPECIES: EAL domain-containing protein [Gammaproteobacteria]RTE85655.1 EAL domain-containing protein [Aliidiomarina sp. B3213]TCZ89624.1 EAL domain-containing protein [Lysobacter sp. N42]